MNGIMSLLEKSAFPNTSSTSHRRFFIFLSIGKLYKTPSGPQTTSSTSKKRACKVRKTWVPTMVEVPKAANVDRIPYGTNDDCDLRLEDIKNRTSEQAKDTEQFVEYYIGSRSNGL